MHINDEILQAESKQYIKTNIKYKDNSEILDTLERQCRPENEAQHVFENILERQQQQDACKTPEVITVNITPYRQPFLEQ